MSFCILYFHFLPSALVLQFQLSPPEYDLPILPLSSLFLFVCPSSVFVQSLQSYVVLRSSFLFQSLYFYRLHLITLPSSSTSCISWFFQLLYPPSSVFRTVILHSIPHLSVLGLSPSLIVKRVLPAADIVTDLIVVL